MIENFTLMGAGVNQPAEAEEASKGRLGASFMGGSLLTLAGPAPANFAHEVSPHGAHEATTSTARRFVRAINRDGENPPARKNLFTPGPDDEGAYCYRCDHLVLEPCDGWLCPIRVW